MRLSEFLFSHQFSFNVKISDELDHKFDYSLYFYLVGDIENNQFIILVVDEKNGIKHESRNVVDVVNEKTFEKHYNDVVSLFSNESFRNMYLTAIENGVKVGCLCILTGVVIE